jgi:hypothetical protein
MAPLNALRRHFPKVHNPRLFSLHRFTFIPDLTKHFHPQIPTFSSQVYSLVRARTISPSPCNHGLRSHILQAPQLRYLWNSYRLGNRNLHLSLPAPFAASQIIPAPPVQQHALSKPTLPAHRIHQVRAIHPKGRTNTHLPPRPH